MLSVWKHEANKSRFLMILGVPPSQGKGGKTNQIVQMASRAYSITPYCQIPGTWKPGILPPRYQESRHLGLLAVRYGHYGTPGSQGCQNVDFLIKVYALDTENSKLNKTMMRRRVDTRRLISGRATPNRRRNNIKF